MWHKFKRRFGEKFSFDMQAAKRFVNKVKELVKESGINPIRIKNVEEGGLI